MRYVAEESRFLNRIDRINTLIVAADVLKPALLVVFLVLLLWVLA